MAERAAAMAARSWPLCAFHLGRLPWRAPTGLSAAAPAVAGVSVQLPMPCQVMALQAWSKAPLAGGCMGPRQQTQSAAGSDLQEASDEGMSWAGTWMSQCAPAGAEAAAGTALAPFLPRAGKGGGAPKVPPPFSSTARCAALSRGLRLV